MSVTIYFRCLTTSSFLDNQFGYITTPTNSKFTLPPNMTLNNTVQAPTLPTGYSFRGWIYTTNLLPLTVYADILPPQTNWSFDVTTANVTVYVWMETEVAFNLNGASGTAPSNQKVRYLSNYLAPTAYSRTGYTQANWNTNADGTGTSISCDGNTKFDWNYGNITITNSPTTLYAIWTAKSYTVQFDLNGATGVTTPTNGTAKYNDPYIGPLISRYGYTHTWNTQADGKGTSFPAGGSTGSTWNLDPSNGIQKLFAIWIINKYNISYTNNLNANSKAFTVEYNSNLTLPTITAVGYNFLGWGSNISDSIVHYAANSILQTSNNTTLYAKWQDKVQIAFDEIQKEFGGTNPISLSEYLKSATSYTSNVTGIPTSGPISFNTFKGKSKNLL